jgi:hypothetical protein
MPNNQGEQREAAADDVRSVSEPGGCLPLAPPCEDFMVLEMEKLLSRSVSFTRNPLDSQHLAVGMRVDDSCHVRVLVAGLPIESPDLSRALSSKLDAHGVQLCRDVMNLNGGHQKQRSVRRLLRQRSESSTAIQKPDLIIE